MESRLKVLGLLSRKGGSGKTSLAIHLAALAAAGGRRVLLVDIDPQGSAFAWWHARAAGEPLLEQTTPDKLAAVMDMARGNGVDLVVIDTRPSVEADAVQVAAVSDFVLVPTRPSILDLRAILATLDIVKGSRKRAAIVMNACQPGRGAADAPTTIEARAALKAFGVPVAPVAIVQRTALAQALVGGLAVSETEPGGKATAEITALWRYIEKELFR